MKKYSVLLVNYKTPSLTARCLELLKANLDLSEADVWVVDNDSKDESTTHLESLDWIHLLQRTVTDSEEPHVSHAQALDLGIENITTQHALCIHTDTFIYDGAIIDLLLSHANHPTIAAVGSLDQVRRPLFRQWCRRIKKQVRHYRRSRVRPDLVDLSPKIYLDQYLKSYCCLWNLDLMKKHNLSFCMGDRNPGYVMQDSLEQLGYRLVALPTRSLFRYIDHAQSGTMMEIGEHSKHHRRSKAYRKFLRRFGKDFGRATTSR